MKEVKKLRPLNRWTLLDGREIDLITPERYSTLPDGTVLVSISGDIKVKGHDVIDQDTRFGYMAFGLPVGVLEAIRLTQAEFDQPITTIERENPSDELEFNQW